MGKYLDKKSIVKNLTRSFGNGWEVATNLVLGGVIEQLILRHAASGTSVLITVFSEEVLNNGSDELWLHASIAGQNYDPSYRDLKILRDVVFGSGYAYQVFAPPHRHVNLHEHAYHLWGRLDGANVLPDFEDMA